MHSSLEVVALAWLSHRRSRGAAGVGSLETNQVWMRGAVVGERGDVAYAFAFLQQLSFRTFRLSPSTPCPPASPCWILNLASALMSALLLALAFVLAWLLGVSFSISMAVCSQHWCQQHQTGRLVLVPFAGTGGGASVAMQVPAVGSKLSSLLGDQIRLAVHCLECHLR